MADARGGANASRGTHSQPRSEEKKTSSRPTSSGPGQNPDAGSKPEPVVLKIDERLRQARERREEQEKLVALRESAWLEREQRARLFYEKQLEERRRKLEEQRSKEEKRRAAVEEKRRLKLEEEKARHEAVMRRTLERSQKAKQKPQRWSWGGGLHGNTIHTSDADRRSVSTVNLSKHPDPVITKRLSSSSATLLNSPDRALQKRTSLLNKPQSHPRLSRERTSRDKPAAAKRLPLTPWESTIVSRLLTPTHSYLARSRSAVSLSGDAASCHPMSATSFKSLQCRNAERPRAPLTSMDAAYRRRTTGTADKREKDKDYVRKSWSNLSIATPAITARSRSPGKQKSRKSAPSPARMPGKPAPRPPTPKQLRSPPPSGLEPLRPALPLYPGNLRPPRALPDPQPERGSMDQGRMVEEPSSELPAAVTKEAPLDSAITQPQPVEEPAEPAPRNTEEPAPNDQDLDASADQLQTPPSLATPSPAPPPASTAKSSAGTTDPEEASRLLAEKRRQAREQREREEEERRRGEEAERRSREEMARRRAEEQARREEKEREERRRREEAEKQAEEERAQREREEAERLEKQKEEEEARQKEAAEQLRLERERHFQKEEAERMQRKKRLEEIMKRTRRSDPPEKKSVPHRNGDLSQEAVDDTASPAAGQDVSSVGQVQSRGLTDLQHSELNGPELGTGTGSTPHVADAQSKENGVPAHDEHFEEVLNLPVGTTLSKLDVETDGLLPVVAFKENRSLRTLVTMDEVQVQQRADVV